jgi:hypothetical protein
VGRLPTGRTTVVVRVPVDLDIEVALHLYYVILPHLLELHASTNTSPRNYNLRKFLDSARDFLDSCQSKGGG